MILYEWYLRHTKEYLSAVYDTYANFIPAVFATYYKNKIVEYDETSMEGYTSPSKPFSPNRFTKIINVPLFLSETLPHAMEINDSGIVQTTSPTTVKMMGRVGFTPRPDDYIMFPAPIGTAGQETLFRITNVEAAMLNVSDPFTTDLQGWSVTITNIDDPASTIEAKVLDTFVYIDRFKVLLTPNNAVVYSDSLSLYKELENYLSANQDRSSQCLQYNNNKFYEATYVYKSLVNPNFSTYQAPFYITPFDVTNVEVFQAVLDTTSMTPMYIETYSLIDPFVISAPPTTEAMRRLYRRNVYISDGTTSTLDFFTLFYPDSTSQVQYELSIIIKDKIMSTYTLIPNSTDNIATIYNKYVTWYTTRTNTLRTSWSNMFEALLLYKLTGQALQILINEAETFSYFNQGA
jgi:hypothetical protein